MGKFKTFLTGEYILKLQGKAERFCGIDILREGSSIKV